MSDSPFTVLDQVELTLGDIGGAVERAGAAGEDQLLREEHLDRALSRTIELLGHLLEWRGGDALAESKRLSTLVDAAVSYGRRRR